LKLLLDEHYATKIAAELRAAGHDTVSVSELQAKGIDDESLLELASSENRALLTNNARDFIPIVGRWAASGRDHCGLRLTSDDSMPRHKGTIGLYVRTLRAIMEANAAPRALANQVRWLP
jgi:predicted nuclease of predicted toxin-antitoxin system